MEKELWVVTGTDPVVWSVPFWSDWDGLGTDIVCAMPLTKFQTEAVARRLRMTVGPNVRRIEKRMTMRELHAVGHKVQPLAHPEDHFVWERCRTANLGPLVMKRRADRDEFLAPMFLRGIGKSLDELEYWLNQFANQMVWHLLNKETPVDLYFCKLHASPYRSNWKMSEKKMDPHHLMEIKRLAWDGRACVRAIDLEYTRTWWALARRIERDRVKLLGKKAYAAEYMAFVERRIETSIRLQRAWMENYRRARPRIAPNNPGELAIFRGCGSPDKASHRADKSLARPDRESAERKKEELAAAKIKTDRKMRAMRLIRRGRKQDLRDARRILHGSSIGPEGEAGLLVRNADQGESLERDLLAARSGVCDGWVV